MSGNGRPARLKRRPWRLDEDKDGFDRPIDRYVANSSDSAGGADASEFAIAAAAMQIGQR